jgi:HEAT repeat protein
MQYVVHVRALAEIGTEDAGRILERQLHRRLTDDQLEQSWYWIDLANGLRTLNRRESLPHLLRCSEAAGELPLGHFFAAETACFLGFGGYLRQPETALGRAALRVLHRALEGLRFGVQPQMIVEARLGEIMEDLWDHRPEKVSPLIVRVAAEVLRLVRRAPQQRDPLTDDATDWEGLEWQMSRLAALEPVLEDYCEEAPPYLRAGLAKARGAEFRDILQALHDLRAEAASDLLPLLQKSTIEHAELILEVLSFSCDSQVGPWLRNWTSRRVAMVRRARQRRQPLSPRRPSVAVDFPYVAVLHALRGHGSPETEEFLLLAANDWDPTYRQAALASLGWWEPFKRPKVLGCLTQARRDPSPEVRQYARAALARLGERAALQWFRNALTGEDTRAVHEAIQAAAQEGLTLLWPDLDRLTEADDPDIAQHAREALEHLGEEMDRGIS